MLLLKEHYTALTAQIAAFSDDFRLVFVDYNGMHEKKESVEKIEDAFETPPTTIIVMKDVRIESVDEDVSIKVNEGSTSVDHQWEGDPFARAGVAQLGLWDRNRSHPDDTSEWGSGSVISILFNPVEPNILATSGNDLGITIYDPGLKDEAIKMFEDNFLMLYKQLKLRVIEIVNKLKEITQRVESVMPVLQEDGQPKRPKREKSKPDMYLCHIRKVNNLC
nr:hypothetical protein [Tanacetum cinerariifolium]